MESNTGSSTFFIRPAVPDDAETIVELIVDLAIYERLRHEAFPEADALRRHLAPEAYPRCEALIAEDSSTGTVLGFALFFHNYSTFLTRFGIYLEDLYVRPEHRSRGVGYALIKRVAEIAVERNCGRLEWNVLEWNELALTFYRKLGARMLEDWRTMRLTGEALQSFGTPA